MWRSAGTPVDGWKNAAAAVDKALAARVWALGELESARNCYATDNYTACVFHLMRMAEHGLRALVTAVGVTTPKVPLEYQQWQNLIEQVESKVGAARIEHWPQPAKANATRFL